MDSSWEELDIDDSDLSSLIRPPFLLPCKRSLHPTTTTTTTTTFSHSLHPRSQSHPPTQNPPSPETLPSQSQQSPQYPLQPNHASPSTTSPRLIPGPAGEFQSAMHRKLDRNRHSRGEDLITTQDCLKEMQELPEEDEDFKRNPWLCALDFLTTNNLSINSTSPLSSITTTELFARLALVVAVVKSCTQNGLGDLILTLKDLTGTVNANVHRKVLTESEFGMDISVGAVLILQKVALFSPLGAHRLNITLKNVVKVIRKDSGPPSGQVRHASFLPSAASREGDCRETQAGMIDKADFMIWRSTERILNEAVRHTQTKGLVNNDEQLEESNTAAGTLPFSSSSNYQDADMEVPYFTSQGADKTATMETGKLPENNEQEMVNDNGRQRAAAISQNSNVTRFGQEHHNPDHDNETERPNGITKEMQKPMPKTILPDWTDEQLEELFADM